MEIAKEFNIKDNIESLRENLLDMSLRNNLLNFKPRRKSIAIYGEDVAELYDILVINEKQMQFLSKDSLDETSLESNEWVDNSEVKDSHLDLYLQTNYEEDELKKKLSTLYRENKTSLEEQGYNSFFLALGFLEWKESNHQDKSLKAPLVLVPLNITRDSVSAPFSVQWNGDDIRSNLSLIFKLQEQGINLPDFEEFDSKEELKDYLNNVKNAISSESQWNVTTDIYLSSFSFKKFVMFKDLDLDQWQNIGSSGVKDIFTADEIDDYEYDWDDELISIKSSEIFNVVDADSSQLVVLEEVKRDKNLVVEGPPGTGKSQTIVNIIAELLARDKKVLFVSEKKSALDVVKSRLDAIGLGEGCLELHGKNSNKKEVLEELRKTLELGAVQLKDDSDFQDLDELKDSLNNYVNSLHANYKETELCAYDLIGMFEQNTQILEDNNQEIYKFNLDNVSDLNTEKRREYIKKLGEIKNFYDLTKPISSNSWINTSPQNLSSPEIRDVEDDFKNLLEILNKYDDLDENISNLIGTDKLNNLNIEPFISNLKLLKPNLKLLEDNEDLDEVISDISKFQDKSKDIDLDVLDLDLAELKEEIDKIMGDIDSLNLNLEIADKEDLGTMRSKFLSNKNYIKESNIGRALDDPNLIPKFNKFKFEKDSFFKRTFNSEFKAIKREFKGYYSFEVSDNQIVADFEKLITVNIELSKLRDKILAYSNQNTSDDKILIESEKLLSWANELDRIKSQLNNYKIGTNYSVLKDNLKDLIELKELLDKIESYDVKGKYYFNDSWNSYKSNVSELKDKLENLKNFKKLYDSGFFSNKIINFINSNEFNELNNKLDDLANCKTKIVDLYNVLNNKLSFKNELNIKDKINLIDINEFKKLMSNLYDSIDDLNNYRLFTKSCNEYSDKCTEDLIELIKEDKVKPECIFNLFYYNFANTALKDIFRSDYVLDEFNYKLHEEKINQFKDLDSNIMKSNQIRVKEVLGNKRPNISQQISPRSSLGMLQREMAKKRKIKPIRKILSETIDVVSTIKPCFMMSPISIAQFLSPNIFENYFDYIIFDEASQVKIEDSIGAMLRGKHYVIMGDTKQLPPTTFFETGLDIDDEDDEMNYTKDLESILHLCKNTFDSKMLRWHYRSRHESLISVSNREFYNNHLFVFPSPMKNSDDLGLKFKFDPSTVYYRGEGANNIKEAENVVDYALDCVRKYRGTKSLGIGTFNLSQSKTIMDVLEKKLQENPELEEYFNESGEEGFFVKNLENIQGYERDIILISVGYGKDQNGKLNLSFGPLNQDGGERRLNVLITRSKEQCVVFSNFKSSEMHTNEGTPRGVNALKTFLYYAETGEFPANYHTGEDFDSPFEESVYNFLTDEGYIVEKQVGCAGYKIDLAIVDKDNANRYVLAIECDGATYHSSRLARDRDRLRQQVLENLGWKFHRIWSTDWFHNRSQAKRRLLDAIDEAVKNKDNVELAKKVESDFKPEVIVKSNDELMDEEINNYFTDYAYFVPNGTNHLDRFMLSSLIGRESPVHVEDIYDRLKIAFNRRATSKFKREFNSVLDNLYSFGVSRKGNFYYKDFDESSFKARRRESPKIDRIPDEEIRKAIIGTLSIQFALEKDSLIKESSKYLGFNTVRSNVKEKFDSIINNMIFAGILIENNNMIQLNK